jgi:hypothetical protein
MANMRREDGALLRKGHGIEVRVHADGETIAVVTWSTLSEREPWDTKLYSLDEALKLGDFARAMVRRGGHQ